MKPTRILTLTSITLLAGFATLILSDLVVRRGQTLVVAPISLVLTLPGISILLVVLAWPLIKYRRAINALIKSGAKTPNETGKSPKRVDPFYAVRVLLLAKSCAITGAVILGWQGGLLIYLLSRPVIAESSAGRAIGCGSGAVLLIATALIVERFCRLPDDAPKNQGAKSEIGEPEASL